MRVLVVAATAMEVGPLVATLGPPSARGPRVSGHDWNGHRVDIVETGVGMVATAAWCSRALSEARYDGALNFGICGSFDRTLPPGTAVHVVSDRVAELGAEDGEQFLSLADLHLLDAEDRNFSRPVLVNEAPLANVALERLPRVSAITVNTVHGRDSTIAAAVRRFNPQVESMEGAAFMYACMIHGVPFAQVRAVSNVVERRNRQAWRMAAALESLSAAALAILESL
jgi:futalosine hydrolase